MSSKVVDWPPPFRAGAVLRWRRAKQRPAPFIGLIPRTAAIFSSRPDAAARSTPPSTSDGTGQLVLTRGPALPEPLPRRTQQDQQIGLPPTLPAASPASRVTQSVRGLQDGTQAAAEPTGVPPPDARARSRPLRLPRHGGGSRPTRPKLLPAPRWGTGQLSLGRCPPVLGPWDAQDVAQQPVGLRQELTTVLGRL